MIKEVLRSETITGKATDAAEPPIDDSSKAKLTTKKTRYLRTVSRFSLYANEKAGVRPGPATFRLFCCYRCRHECDLQAATLHSDWGQCSAPCDRLQRVDIHA